MPEADVLYSNVKFTRAKGNASGTASPSAEATYSEVKISKPRASTELPGSQQQAGSNGGPKRERVALVVVSVLLAAAVVALGVASYKILLTMERLQKLSDEHEAMTERQHTERPCEVESCNTVQPTCPQPPAVQTTGSCLTCTTGWEQHGGKCYKFSTSYLDWDMSRRDCRNRGGDLVKIDSREEQVFLELKLRDKMNVPEDKFWIGLTDSEEEGRWLWVDGSPLDPSLTFWSGKEPDNYKKLDTAGEDCARMGEKAGAHDLKCWFDQSCKVPHRSICEKPAETGRVMCAEM